MATTQQRTVLGLMSGSSLDGLDLALCRFEFQLAPNYTLLGWEILEGTTLPYGGPWQARLKTAPYLPAQELWRLHTDLGRYLGQVTHKWLERQKHSAELIGSHGHTVFHDPKRGFTTQIGDGAQISYHTGLPVVSDLRSSDLAAGGQGAPIAPLADRFLFPSYNAFLNLGGIANCCVKGPSGELIAGDSSGANQILDTLAQSLGMPYDDNGLIARSGATDETLLLSLQAVPFHQQAFPKSLSNAWVVDTLLPIIQASSVSVADKLNTFCQFLAWQVHQDLNAGCRKASLSPQPVKVLVSGGGAHNGFLLHCLRKQVQDDQYPLGYEVAEPPLADLKEAAMVALSALHRQLGIPNAFSSATGAAKDTVNGAMYLPS